MLARTALSPHRHTSSFVPRFFPLSSPFRICFFKTEINFQFKLKLISNQTHKSSSSSSTVADNSSQFFLSVFDLGPFPLPISVTGTRFIIQATILTTAPNPTAYLDVHYSIFHSISHSGTRWAYHQRQQQAMSSFQVDFKHVLWNHLSQSDSQCLLCLSERYFQDFETDPVIGTGHICKDDSFFAPQKGVMMNIWCSRYEFLLRALIFPFSSIVSRVLPAWYSSVVRVRSDFDVSFA